MNKIHRNDKRDRLVDAADSLIYQQSFHNTTLADIAKLADVPLGNVYYYFKTKVDIITAVLAKRVADLKACFETLAQSSSASDRLTGLIDYFASNEMIARFGCQYGSLCQELAKQPEHAVIAKQASELITLLLVWVVEQFKTMGQPDSVAQKNGEHFVAQLQGFCLLALVFHDNSLLKRHAKDLLRTQLAEIA